MSDSSTVRTQANSTFLKTQTKAFALDRLQSDMDAVRTARDANMVKLKQLRLAREAADRDAAALAPAKQRTRKSKAKSVTIMRATGGAAG
jgi:hypothetical protein